MHVYQYDLHTAKGRFLTDSFFDLLLKQCEWQGAFATINGVDVSGVDFDSEKFIDTARALKLVLAAGYLEAMDSIDHDLLVDIAHLGQIVWRATEEGMFPTLALADDKAVAWVKNGKVVVRMLDYSRVPAGDMAYVAEMTRDAITLTIWAAARVEHFVSFDQIAIALGIDEKAQVEAHHKAQAAAKKKWGQEL